jgi:DNA-binding MarR family transcriptional regulator/GNAT superfamily N-acetyltransferase
MTAGLEHRVEDVRRFNRFYTRQIGVLNEGMLRTPFSLSEARVLYEIAHQDRPTATDICLALGIDAGYLSRMLREFKRRGLVSTRRAQNDGRQRLLTLTPQGRRTVATLDTRSRREVAALLGHQSPVGQRRLLDAMQTIRSLLGDPAQASQEPEPPYTLRTHRPGDMGWVVHRHGAVYAAEYGWDERFEAFVASIVARFIERFDATCERCWIAERHGEIVGSVFLVRHTKTVAKLRLLLVEPSARGLGLGTRLVDECIRFAREVGYRRMTLWTNSILDAARHVYEKAGFRRVGRESQHRFGHDLVFETWELTL